jgi:predicted transcriptional regulator
MKRLFLKLKPSAVLLLLKDSSKQWYPSSLARAAGSSYVHTVNLLAQLRKMGVVQAETKGRQHLYRLTEKGAYLAASLDDFAKKCEAYEQEAAAQSKHDAAQVAPSPQQKEGEGKAGEEKK